MRHELQSQWKPYMMRSIVLFLCTSFLVCFVYSAGVSNILKGGINVVQSDGKNEKPTWTYACEETCLRKRADQTEIKEIMTLETCLMLCADLPLWPKPTEIRTQNKQVSTFTKNRMTIKLNTPNNIKNDLKQASNIFIKNLPPADDVWIDDKETTLFNIHINVTSVENVLKISTIEHYFLSVKKVENNIEVNILATTYFGARHGLETLSQLIWLDTNTKKLNVIHHVEINDIPKFAHRGLMVDTARNYFHVEQLMKVVDGMAATKLNVFHLHLTDAASFPIVLPRNEQFAKYASYGPDMVYTAQNIKDLIEYARIRGIRVILEIDGPSHMSQNLNQAVKDLVVCGDEVVFNGHLNPENNKTLQVLQDIYKDLLDLGTDSDMFHIGGDEVNVTCWEQVLKSSHNPNQSYDVYSLWKDFTNKMFESVVSANKRLPRHIVLWSSDLTDWYISQLKYKDNIVVQYWFGGIFPILNNGNKIIISTVGQWYLDCGYGSWKTDRDVGACDPYTTWHTFYRYRPWVEEFPAYRDQVLGGEACLWTEEVEEEALETRIWPRAAALAERLWSDPDGLQGADVFTRLDIHRERLKRRGIKSEGIWPRWCSQNPGKC